MPTFFKTKYLIFMAEQNLILNILTSNHPVEQKDFAFYTEKKNGSFPINKYEFPVNIEEIFPGRSEKCSLNKAYFTIKMIQDNYQRVYSIV